MATYTKVMIALLMVLGLGAGIGSCVSRAQAQSMWPSEKVLMGTGSTLEQEYDSGAMRAPIRVSYDALPVGPPSTPDIRYLAIGDDGTCSGVAGSLTTYCVTDGGTGWEPIAGGGGGGSFTPDADPQQNHGEYESRTDARAQAIVDTHTAVPGAHHTEFTPNADPAVDHASYSSETLSIADGAVTAHASVGDAHHTLDPVSGVEDAVQLNRGAVHATDAGLRLDATSGDLIAPGLQVAESVGGNHITVAANADSSLLLPTGEQVTYTNIAGVPTVKTPAEEFALVHVPASGAVNALNLASFAQSKRPNVSQSYSGDPVITDAWCTHSNNINSQWTSGGVVIRFGVRARTMGDGSGVIQNWELGDGSAAHEVSFTQADGNTNRGRNVSASGLVGRSVASAGDWLSNDPGSFINGSLLAYVFSSDAVTGGSGLQGECDITLQEYRYTEPSIRVSDSETQGMLAVLDVDEVVLVDGDPVVFDDTIVIGSLNPVTYAAGTFTVATAGSFDLSATLLYEADASTCGQHRWFHTDTDTPANNAYSGQSSAAYRLGGGNGAVAVQSGTQAYVDADVGDTFELRAIDNGICGTGPGDALGITITGSANYPSAAHVLWEATYVAPVTGLEGTTCSPDGLPIVDGVPTSQGMQCVPYGPASVMRWTFEIADVEAITLPYAFSPDMTAWSQ